MQRSSYKPYLLLLLVSGILFIPFLGRVHLFDWDEINFAEMAREMIVTGNYAQLHIDYFAFWEKPPLFIWMQAISMKLFGVSEFAARLPNALVGMASLLVLFHIGKRWFSESFGWLWVLAYGGSFLPHLYFKSGIIDPTFNLFIFLGVYHLFLVQQAYANGKVNQWRSSVLAAFFIGLAVLTKGPVGALLPGLTLAFIWGIRKGRPVFSWKALLMMILVGLLVICTWFGYEVWQNGWWFVEEFIVYQLRLLTTQDAGHGGPFYYHFIVILVGCFPASIFIFRAFKRQTNDTSSQADLKHWMIILLGVVLMVFSLVTTKIVHYSSLAYFPLTFLTAYVVYQGIQGQLKWKVWMTWLGGFLGAVICLALIMLPFVGLYKDALVPYIKDPFAVANLEAAVYWGGWETLIGLAGIAALCVGLFWLSRQKWMQGAVALFGGMVVVIQLALLILVPKIEGYSQRAAIEFCESLQGQEVYITSVGHKSYAPYFYGRIQKPSHRPDDIQDSDQWRQWLLRGKIDRDAYFIARMDRLDRLKLPDDVKEVGRKNGFVFLKREH